MQIKNHRSWLLSVAVMTSWAITVAHPGQAVAQTPGRNAAADPVMPLTLSAALKLARNANPDLGVARLELEATEGALMQGQARPNPEASYSVEDASQVTRTTTLQFSQQIELGGKRAARIDAAERGRDMASPAQHGGSRHQMDGGQ